MFSFFPASELFFLTWKGKQGLNYDEFIKYEIMYISMGLYLCIYTISMYVYMNARVMHSYIHIYKYEFIAHSSKMGELYMHWQIQICSLKNDNLDCLILSTSFNMLIIRFCMIWTYCLYYQNQGLPNRSVLVHTDHIVCIDTKLVLQSGGIPILGIRNQPPIPCIMTL